MPHDSDDLTNNNQEIVAICIRYGFYYFLQSSAHMDIDNVDGNNMDIEVATKVEIGYLPEKCYAQLYAYGLHYQRKLSITINYA